MAPMIYTINVCPDCGAQQIEDREGDPVCPTHGWRVDWQEVEVVPRAIVEPVVAAAAATMPRIQDDLTLALAEYRQAIK